MPEFFASVRRGRPKAAWASASATVAVLALAGCQSAPDSPGASSAVIDWLALAQAQGQYPHQAPFLEPFAS